MSEKLPIHFSLEVRTCNPGQQFDLKHLLCLLLFSFSVHLYQDITPLLFCQYPHVDFTYSVCQTCIFQIVWFLLHVSQFWCHFPRTEQTMCKGLFSRVVCIFAFKKFIHFSCTRITHIVYSRNCGCGLLATRVEAEVLSVNKVNPTQLRNCLVSGWEPRSSGSHWMYWSYMSGKSAAVLCETGVPSMWMALGIKFIRLIHPHICSYAWVRCGHHQACLFYSSVIQPHCCAFWSLYTHLLTEHKFI